MEADAPQAAQGSASIDHGDPHDVACHTAGTAPRGPARSTQIKKLRRRTPKRMQTTASGVSSLPSSTHLPTYNLKEDKDESPDPNLPLFLPIRLALAHNIVVRETTAAGRQGLRTW